MYAAEDGTEMLMLHTISGDGLQNRALVLTQSWKQYSQVKAAPHHGRYGCIEVIWELQCAW